MPSPFRQLFRKTDRDSSGEAAGIEDLECGHPSLVPQTTTSSGLELSPHKIYPPVISDVPTPTEPRSLNRSCAQIPQVHFNVQNELAVQLPLMPSGTSRVIGYLPRATCDSLSTCLTPAQHIMPSQHSQSTSGGDWIGSNGPQCRSNVVPSIAFHRSLSPRPPFDPYKHGQALQRLETHGSLKTVPTIQREGGALHRTSTSRLRIRRKVSEDHDAIQRDSHPQYLESQTPIDTNAASIQQTGFDFSLPPGRSLPNNVRQPVELNRTDLSAIVDVTSALNTDGGQIFKKTLPNCEAISSSKVTQQETHSSQVPPKPHQVLPSNPIRRKTLAGASPYLRSKIPTSEGIFENDKVGRMTNNFDTGTRNSKQYSNLPTFEKEEEKEQQRCVRDSASEQPRQAFAIVESPVVKSIDEFLWSPAPSDDGQEAPSVPYTTSPSNTRSDAFLAVPDSGLVSDSKSCLSASTSHDNEAIRSWTDSSGSPRAFDTPLPQIDVLIPAGRINLSSHTNFLGSSQPAATMGSRGSSSMQFRYSGTITNGASSRPMPEVELKDKVRISLEDQEESSPSMPSPMKAIDHADHRTSSEQIRQEHEPSTGSEVFPLDLVRNPSADAGPGSSQTSSSISTDRCGGDLSGYKMQSEIRMLPTSRARCHTPPLLFGNSATRGPKRSPATTGLALGSAIGQFDQNLKAVIPNKTGCLPSTLYSLGEQDWETISARTEAHTNSFGAIACNTKTGSSLADNSDSGHLSLPKEIAHPFRSIESRPVMQHPAHPRHNYSLVLLKNSQTGDLVQVPQYEHTSGGHLLDNNASSPLVLNVRADNSYQHPSPLQVEHTHPLTCSPSIFRFREPSGIHCENNHVWVQQNPRNPDSSSSGISEGDQWDKEERTQKHLYKTTQDVLHTPRSAAKYNQDHMSSREQSRQSSPWFSTISEVTTSSEPSLPRSGHPLTNMIVRNSSEHVDSAPEQIINRHMGNTLVDASNPGASFSSSPVLASSPTQNLNTRLWSRQTLHKQAIQQSFEFSSQHILANVHESLTRSFNRESSAMSASNTKLRSRSHSACELRLEHHKLLPRQRRSSSESSSGLMNSPSTQMASATSLLPLDRDAQRVTISGSFPRNPFLHIDEIESWCNRNQPYPVERRRRQPKMDDVSIGDPAAPSSAKSGPFMRRGIGHTDAPAPVLDHRVYCHERPWDLLKPGPLGPRPSPKPPGPHSSQRLIARAESPHLHRILHPHTTGPLERHVLLSRVYLISSMMIPPIALLYGHGYMDSLMQLHTAGEISGFRTTEKIIALCWGYGSSAICVFAVIITMIIIPASA